MIRKYKESEIPELIIIWEHAIREAHSFLSDEFNQMVKKAMTDTYLPNSDTWVFVYNDAIIGFISMINNEIGGLFVAPAYQSIGVGTKLVNFVNQKHPILEVEVFDLNILGKAFYTKNKFQIIRKYYHEPSGQEVLFLRRANAKRADF